MLTSNDLSYMRSVENLALGSTGIIYRQTYGTSPLGLQDESWAAIGTVSCDVWPIGTNNNENIIDSQKIASGRYFISFPYNTDILESDIVDISSKTYQITFVPENQTWQTNLRVEAINYNNELRTK